MCEKYTNERKKTSYTVYRLIIFNREKNYRPLKIFDPVHKTSCVVHLDSVMGCNFSRFMRLSKANLQEVKQTIFIRLDEFVAPPQTR